jgi:hypothetical protein
MSGTRTVASVDDDDDAELDGDEPCGSRFRPLAEALAVEGLFHGSGSSPSSSDRLLSLERLALAPWP